jgi:hypothetical protein
LRSASFTAEEDLPGAGVADLGDRDDVDDAVEQPVAAWLRRSRFTSPEDASIEAVPL